MDYIMEHELDNILEEKMEEIENNEPSIFTEDLEKLRILLEKKRDNIDNFLKYILPMKRYLSVKDEYFKNFLNIKSCCIYIDFYIKEIIENIEELNKMEIPDIKTIHEIQLYPGIRDFIWKLSKK